MRKAAARSVNSLDPNALGIVPRERLFRLLDRLLEHSILWIGGPPGSGRTTLVESFLDARQIRASWCEVVDQHRDPGTQGCQLRLTGARPHEPPQGHDKSAKVARLVELSGCTREVLREFFASLPIPGALVVDGCHGIARGSPLHALLAESAADAPRGLSVFLIGRGDPPAAYTRLLANKTMGVLDADELRFTAEETRALASGVCTDRQVLEALRAQLSGWAAGLALVLQKFRRGGATVQAVEQAAREVACSYFSAEVFGSATAEERRILVSTALIPVVTSQAAGEVSGSAQAQQLLEKMANEQLYTRRIAAAHPTFEYEPPFREFLLSRTEETLPPPELKEVARRASAICNRLGDLDSSAALAVQSANWDTVQRLIFQHGLRLIAQGHSATVQRWIDAVPADIHTSEPWLAYWSGVALIPCNPVSARARLELAWEGFQVCADLAGQIVSAAAMLETYQGEWTSVAPAYRWIDCLEVGLGAGCELPSRELELRVFASLLFGLAFIRPAEGLADRCSGRLRELMDSDLDVHLRLSAGRSLVLWYCAVYDIASARDVSRQLQSMLQEQDCSASARVATLNVIAHSHWVDCCYPEAESTLREAAGIASEHRLKFADPLHLQVRHQVAFARGEGGELSACIQALRQVVEPTRLIAMAMLSQASAEQAQLREDWKAAVNHWGAAAAYATDAGALPMRWLSQLALEGCRATLGDCTTAARSLEQARARINGAAPANWHRDAEWLGAFIALRRAEAEECRRRIGLALNEGRNSAAASPLFTLMPSPMAEVSQEALQAGIAVDSMRSLIRRYRLLPPQGADLAWPWPFRVFVLGRFRILKDDAPINFSRRVQKRTLELLQALIAMGGTEVAAGVLTDSLWPDSEGDAAYHALESALYRLRQLLGEPAAVTMAGGKISLDRRYFWVDMWALEREMQQSSRSPGTAARLGAIQRLYQGHFLEQESDKSWALDTRQALRDRFVRSIRETARSYESQGLWQEAASAYQTAIDRDGLAEDLYRGLMLCHRELGEHSEAMHVYRRCRELLTRVLGVQPNVKTQAIYNSIRQSQVAHAG